MRQRQRRQEGGDEGGEGEGVREEGLEEEEEDEDEEDEQGALMLPRVYQQQDLVVHQRLAGEPLPVGFVKLEDLHPEPIDHRQRKVG